MICKSIINGIMNKSTPQAAILASGWRRENGDPSLGDVFRTIRVPHAAGNARKLVAFLGPGYLVAVGYMDPGNWATSLAGGSQFGYTLLVVALMSNIMAIILQSLCARLAIATGRDLAQACRDAFPRRSPGRSGCWPRSRSSPRHRRGDRHRDRPQSVFGIPLEIGVIITALDVFLILYLQSWASAGSRLHHLAARGIAVCFAVQIALADPEWGGVIRGFAPTTEIVTNPEMLYLALGIIGATVMPHNLYLHSGIVQTRAYGDSDAGEARGAEASRPSTRPWR